MQKFIPPIIISLIIALWVSSIAILSIQNATPVSLKFIGFQSINIPIGIILSFSVSIGIIISSLVMPPLFYLKDMKDNQEDF
ncbi:DUF1049 domain-containing protein [Okeania sp.]|uniref:DUF1049 domain-containing protein n=1 Tax=Okeania sp. TaxID=3100323 RepID=UPI002B4AF196|nr:DUF1049 domain-containing protein [Okeania sp.]MEB3339706.1 DUF1049 domain-containing protein [Okeania sp.]